MTQPSHDTLVLELALAAARASGVCVVHVQNAWREGHPDINARAPWQADAKAAGRSTEGSWGIEFFEPLAPLDGELVVRKRAVSGFVGTGHPMSHSAVGTVSADRASRRAKPPTSSRKALQSTAPLPGSRPSRLPDQTMCVPPSGPGIRSTVAR